MRKLFFFAFSEGERVLQKLLSPDEEMMPESTAALVGI